MKTVGVLLLQLRPPNDVTPTTYGSPPWRTKRAAAVTAACTRVGTCRRVVLPRRPYSPSALAKVTGLHPATLTGVLDRLERGGWIARDRDPSDRRAVQVRALRERNGELLQLYSGMNKSLDDICKMYDAEQLEVISDFLRRTTEAGRAASEELD